jgi:hypothetical protein
MNLHPLNESPDFSSYSFLELNEKGRFIDRCPDGMKFEVDSNCLYAYFQRLIRLLAGVTDVFVLGARMANYRSVCTTDSATIV